MSSRLPLRAIRVHLTGSVPVSATPEESAGIRSFVEKFTGAILREGGTLIHGSHPSFLEPLKTASQPFVAAGGARDALTFVRSHKFAQTPEQLAEIAAQREYSVVQIIPGPQVDETQSLVSMREWIAEHCDVVVAIGGKWSDQSGSC